MFARINHELLEREVLEQERQGLLKKKQGLIADNKKRKDDLASLDKDLETFIDVRDLHFQAPSRECVMLTHTRLPNLYKGSSRSNIEHSRPTAPFSEDWQLSLEPDCGFLPGDRRSKGVTYWGEGKLKYPFRDINTLRAFLKH